MIEIKACPYSSCRSEETYLRNKFYGAHKIENMNQVYCLRCGASGPFKDTPEAAIEAWNKVAGMREALEKVSKIVEDVYQPSPGGTKKEKSVNAVVRLHYILEEVLKGGD